MFSHPDYDGHERVVYLRDARAGLSAIIALHSTALGPAFGGCRMWPYRDDGQALADVLRLSRGMTYKAAICELPFGGGKSVILGDSRRDKTPELLRAMGRAVESLGGRYIIADDVGTTLDDLAVMRQETSHTAAATAAAKAPLAVTAYGVFCALRAATRHYFGRDDFEGLRVAVQGLGNVGMPLCRYLHGKGARLVVCDMDPARARQASESFGAQAVPVEAIYDAEVDIFAPSALGGILNDHTIGRLKARLVCGGANNQLEHSRHDAALARRDIAYVPDYLANAGGVIDFHQEAIDDRPEAVMASVERIGRITADVLDRAKRDGARPLAVCDAIVRQRLSAAR
ncbi:MAG: Glu/Leu/Phe/Val dehydrogenase [Alphaproteobacteria bacterium]|nr:Glu/Leu/Phe/Val dehydrogenase [Alphaproteobacteria bacterium]